MQNRGFRPDSGVSTSVVGRSGVQNKRKSTWLRFCEQSCAVDLFNGGKSAAATAFANKQTAAGPAASTQLKFSLYIRFRCLFKHTTQSVNAHAPAEIQSHICQVRIDNFGVQRALRIPSGSNSSPAICGFGVLLSGIRMDSITAATPRAGIHRWKFH